ncbi:MAG: NAD(P)/FAD-dependent oxidoreductase [Nocardiopsaceae bacterium]|jgi:NADH dehydrogenase|nr:NAD(P)/FAD-dependent oxidoreductase [Nocardiopsaceae bacterium]
MNAVGTSGSRPRVVIAGGGFAGFHAARRLGRLAKGKLDIALINPTDYFLYLPLLPEVTSGILDPRTVAAPLTSTRSGVRLVLGAMAGIDMDARTVTVRDPEDNLRTVGYDHLVVALGSVNKLLPVPGVTDTAHGFRSLAEAIYLRDHLLRQLEIADLSDDPAEREARCTFVVVGAGSTGTEVAAAGQLLTRIAARRQPGLSGQEMRWILADVAPRVLPELDPRLSADAHRVLSKRGMELRTGTSVEHATHEGVKLSDGEFVPTRSLIWCVGVRPDPMVEQIGLPMNRGRLDVDEYLVVPEHPEIHACGDAAAVPDLTRPGSITSMTAQNAVRQGALVADNIATSYGIKRGEPRPYRHRDLGFVVDLAGTQAAANPLGIRLSGITAKVVTRGYHLWSMPANRLRIATDWLLDIVLPRQLVQMGLIRSGAVPLASGTPEHPESPASATQKGR